MSTTRCCPADLDEDENGQHTTFRLQTTRNCCIPDGEVVSTFGEPVALPQLHAKIEGFLSACGREEERLVRGIINRRNPGRKKRERTACSVSGVLELRKERLPATEGARLWETAEAIDNEQKRRLDNNKGRTSHAGRCMQLGRRCTEQAWKRRRRIGLGRRSTATRRLSDAAGQTLYRERPQRESV